MSEVKVTRRLWVAVQITTCMGRGHIVAATLQAARLVMPRLHRLGALCIDGRCLSVRLSRAWT